MAEVGGNVAEKATNNTPIQAGVEELDDDGELEEDRQPRTVV